MVNMTLTISETLRDELKKHKEVNWSAIARIALEEHLKKIEMIEKIVGKSKLTQKDADEIAKKVKKGIAKELGLLK